jgi:hypothetical protein
MLCCCSFLFLFLFLSVDEKNGPDTGADDLLATDSECDSSAAPSPMVMNRRIASPQQNGTAPGIGLGSGSQTGGGGDSKNESDIPPAMHVRVLVAVCNHTHALALERMVWRWGEVEKGTTYTLRRSYGGGMHEPIQYMNDVLCVLM